MLTFNISHGSKAVRKQLLTGFAIAILSVSASAIPMLQLDIVGGTYNETDETMYATGNEFTLQAMYKGGAPMGTTFYISAAIVPNTTDGDFGSFSVVNGNENTYTSADASYGTPPADDLYPNLPKHGIFPTYYVEIPFEFNQGVAPAYNVEKREFESDDMQVVTFRVNIANLNAGLALHFDLYDEYVKTKRDTLNYQIGFAPFSHDAQSLVVDKNTGGSPNLVPDASTTMTLMGAALMGLGALRRRWNS